MRPTLRAIRALPKADLHSHIDGSVPVKDLFRIAKRHHRRVLTPKGNELDSALAFMRFVEGDGYDSLLENVVDRFYPITNLMQTEGVIRDVAASYVAGKKEDGVAYAEGRFAPQYHTREGLAVKEAIESMGEGLAEGAEASGVEANLIIAIGRESSPETGEGIARAARASRLGVALDLGGPEAGNPPQKFRRAFDIARDSGLKLTIHAGEGAGSRAQNLANIRTAVALGANRIGHAVDLSTSDDLIALLRSKSVAVEANPISNLVLRKISDLRDLGIARLLSEGIGVSLNSDDPSLWPKGALSDVYYSVCDSYGFGFDELDLLAENAFSTAFVARTKTDRLAEEYHMARKRLS